MSKKWLILWIFCICFKAFAQEPTVYIALNDLEIYLIQNSPQIKMINQDYKLIKNEKNIHQQWSNPELGYEFEKIKAGGEIEKEQVFTVSKHFESPWTYLKNKSYWKDVLQSESYSKKQKLRDFIAEMKSGYVQISIMSAQKEYLNKVKSEVESILTISGNQYKEGAISGMKQQLIKMALFNINAGLTELNQMQMQMENQWKTKAGIHIEVPIKLDKNLAFKPVYLDSVQNMQKRLKFNPGLLAEKSLALAIKKQIGIEKLKILPEFSFTGGYKTTGENRKGYIFGVSMPIPLFNFNRPQIQKHIIELNHHNYQVQMTTNHLLALVKEYKTSIQTIGSLLNESSNPLSASLEEFEKIKISYSEGWISLNDLLSSIELYSNYIQNHNSRLSAYYDYIFKLEAVTGKKLIGI